MDARRITSNNLAIVPAAPLRQLAHPHPATPGSARPIQRTLLQSHGITSLLLGTFWSNSYNQNRLRPSLQQHRRLDIRSGDVQLDSRSIPLSVQ